VILSTEINWIFLFSNCFDPLHYVVDVFRLSKPTPNLWVSSARAFPFAVIPY
jgi:hypothetical protein